MREVRAGGEVRVSGRTLTGVAMPYGTVSPDFRERFEPGTFGDVPGRMATNLQHDPAVVLIPAALLTDDPRALSVRAELGEGSGAVRPFARQSRRSRSSANAPAWIADVRSLARS